MLGTDGHSSAIIHCPIRHISCHSLVTLASPVPPGNQGKLLGRNPGWRGGAGHRNTGDKGQNWDYKWKCGIIQKLIYNVQELNACTQFSDNKSSHYSLSSPEYPVVIFGSGPAPKLFIAWTLISQGTKVGVFLRVRECFFTVSSFHSVSTPRCLQLTLYSSPGPFRSMDFSGCGRRGEIKGGPQVGITYLFIYCFILLGSKTACLLAQLKCILWHKAVCAFQYS